MTEIQILLVKVAANICNINGKKCNWGGVHQKIIKKKKE